MSPRRSFRSALSRLNLLFWALVLGSAPAEAQQQLGPESPIPLDPTIVTGELENGLRYFVKQNSRPEGRAELRLVVNAGSILEDDDQLGLAHLVEHMAFNGTENFEKQELVNYLESIGMEFGPSINAYTSFDETVYMLRVPTDDPDILATAFQILEDWAHGVSFDPEEIDKERGVVIEEWRLGLGAGSRIRDQQLPVILHESRYADRLPIGDPEILATFPHERLTQFYEDWYRPDLMAIVAVGDFDPSEVEQAIRSHFAGLTAPADPRRRQAFPVPDHQETLFTVATDPEATSTSLAVLYKHPAQPKGTAFTYRQGLIESLYNRMLNNRLFEIVQQPGAPFAFAASGQGSFARGTEIYQLFAGVPEGNVLPAMEAVLLEAERVARFGFTASEIEREKVDLLRGLQRAYAERENQESAALAAEYIRHFLDGEPVPGIDAEYALAEALLPTISLAEVNAVATILLSDENRVVTVDGPEKPGLAWPTEEELAGVFASVEASILEPYRDAVSDQPLVAELPVGSPVVREGMIEGVEVTEWVLQNGVRVLLKPTDFKDDEVLVSAWSWGGYSLSAVEDHASASAADLLTSQMGLGEFSVVDLQKQLAGVVAGVQPSIGPYTEGLSGSASPQDLETLFQLIYLHFTAPRRDPDAFQALMARFDAALANIESSPQAAFQDTLALTMAQHHPRVQPVSREWLDGLDMDLAVDFFADRFADASDFTFVFAGALDLETMRPLVEQYLGGLPSTGRTESWEDMGIEAPTGVVERTVRKGVEPQSQTVIAFTGDFDWTRENRLGMRTLAGALEIRLRELLREELGGTYGVGVSGGYDSVPRASYDFRIQFGSDPARTDELVESMFAEIRDFQENGPTADEIQTVLEQERRSRETNLQQNGWWVGQIVGATRYDTDLTLLLDMSLLDDVTPESVQEDARRYLRFDNYVRVTLLPETEPGVSDR
jgi:zinc protease